MRVYRIAKSVFVFAKRLAVTATLSVPLVQMPAARAEDMTAGTVMSKMKPEERYSYFAGIVEGLAYARYVKDDRKTDGMACIYNWFYENKAAMPKINSAFDHFKDHTPGAVMAALVGKECASQ